MPFFTVLICVDIYVQQAFLVVSHLQDIVLGEGEAFVLIEKDDERSPALRCVPYIQPFENKTTKAREQPDIYTHHMRPSQCRDLYPWVS
jgi:hypothetical protein